MKVLVVKLPSLVVVAVVVVVVWCESQERLVVVRGRGTALVSKHNPH